MNDICFHCGQKIKLARKEVFNKGLCTSLQTAAVYISATGKNDFDIHTLFNDTNTYNNFQKLRFFGLVHHVTKNGVNVRGHWLITRNGWAFLRGEQRTHKWVKVQNNRIIEHSPETIRVQDAYHGSEVIHTTFEYFDASGYPVGYRPVYVDKQTTIFRDATGQAFDKEFDHSDELREMQQAMAVDGEPS